MKTERYEKQAFILWTLLYGTSGTQLLHENSHILACHLLYKVKEYKIRVGIFEILSQLLKGKVSPIEILMELKNLPKIFLAIEEKEWEERGIIEKLFISEYECEIDGFTTLGKLLGHKLCKALIDFAGIGGEIAVATLLYLIGKRTRKKLLREISFINYIYSCFQLPFFFIRSSDFSHAYRHIGIYSIPLWALLYSLYPITTLVCRFREKKEEEKAVKEAIERLAEDSIISEKTRKNILNLKSLDRKTKEIVKNEIELYQELLKGYPSFVNNPKEYVKKLYSKWKFILLYDESELSRRMEMFYEGEVSSAYKALFDESL
jgi:hypothetical protein